MIFHQKKMIFFIISILAVSLSVISGNSYFALLVSGLLIILTFLNRETGLLLLLLYFPLRPFLIEMNPGLKITGDLIILALLIWTVYYNRNNIRSLFQFELFEIALFAFCIIGVISALITGVELISIISQIRAYILLYLVYYTVKRMPITDEFIFKSILLTFITAVIISLHGFVEKISDKTFLLPEAWINRTLSATNHVRVYGLLKGPNELALYLLIAFILSLFLLTRFSGWKKWSVFAGLSIIGTTFFLTYSRGAFLSLIIFFIIYLLLFRNIKKLIPVAAIIISSTVLFFAVTTIAESVQETMNSNNTTGYKRYTEAFSKDTVEKSGTDGRIYYVTKAIEVFKSHPIIGTGFGTFGGAAAFAYSSPIYEKFNINSRIYSDNQYILTLAETGIIGVLALSIFVLSILFIIIKAFKQSKDQLSIILIFFFTTMLVGGLVYNILENDTFMLYYFLVLGLTFQRFNKAKNH
mgnify:FL=1